MVSPKDLVQQLSSNSKLRTLLADAGGSDALAGLDEWVSENLADARPSAIDVPGPATIEAAVSYAQPTTGERDRSLVEHSEAVTIDGARWLKLKDKGRAEILRSATESVLDTLLGEHAADDLDLLATSSPDAGLDVPLASAWLRQILRGAELHLDALNVRHLRAVTAAVSSLSACREFNPTIPDEAEVERRLSLAELRQPLEILVGQDARGQDRFVGRADEMRRLRTFVDVLGSRTVYEAVSRGVKRLGRSVATLTGETNARGLTLVAGGGLGKSTLVAKFALDHFLQPESAIPFIYFDFDRASLQPREPSQLLIEAARQISLEFPSLSESMSMIRRRLRSDLNDRDRVYDEIEPPSQATVVMTTRDSLSDPYIEFGDLLREAARSSRSGVALVVLDTMEMVQSDPEAISGIVQFLRRLCERPFPELRIVAAGRAEITELNQIPGLDIGSDKIELDALNATDAREMVNRLGRALMAEDWNEGWTAMLVGGDRDPKERRVPLTLRVALELLRDAAPAEREGLVREIAELGATANKDLVGRLYVRRIVRHVRDKDARALAWPGLVARRITRDVLNNVIAPVTGLAGARVDSAFEKLAREVWMVERDGDALVHRADLRARTLPFMQAHDKETFGRLTHSLRDYYRSAGDTVESSYYRLLSGEHPDFLSDEIDGRDFNLLAPAAEDFESDWHPKSMPYARLTYTYLRSRRGPLMQRRAFEALPPELGYSHLRRAGAGVCSLDDAKAHLILSAFRKAPVSVSRMGRDELVTRQTVLIKTGAWSKLQKAELLLPSETRDAVVLAFYLARRAKAEQQDLTRALVSEFQPSLGGDAWRVSAYLLPYLYAFEPDLFLTSDADLARMPPERISDKPASLGAIRSALSVAQGSFPILIQRWAEFNAQQPGRTATLSGGEASALQELLADNSFRDRFFLEEGEQRLIGEVSSHSIQSMPFRAESLVVPHLSQGLVRDLHYWEPAGGQLRAFFNARHDDWIVPVGYAVQSELSQRDVVASIRALFERHEPPKSLHYRAWALLSSRASFPIDGIEIAKRANEAGDLAGLLKALRQHGSIEGAVDIDLLQDSLEAWNRLLDLGVRGQYRA
ncbi:hypothetical protein IB279_34340 [Ensifer sp. ENS06]|uniref:hypothetical protein n=1 Tax=Ensifer sp. ENS06 TaxID=2769276 RepID=UPI00177CAF78|nr:hypothetical protein [Ensifer sp. ENS06]MBD9628033.1 hypothetical protein [Ensifer sp. ENS06]